MYEKAFVENVLIIGFILDWEPKHQERRNTCYEGGKRIAVYWHAADICNGFDRKSSDDRRPLSSSSRRSRTVTNIQRIR